MTALVIGEGTQVTLHFSLTLKSGHVVDSNFDQEPAQFVFGDGNLLEGFEKAILGLPAGTREVFTISAEDGFGQANPSNIQTFKRDQFADDLELEEGLMLSFADAQNAELPGVVASFDETMVTVDFNHPLAGKEIEFEVQILSVDPSVKH
ncbi:MAG: FKBP-type peptidyl-prolyl cis-trans isomerase SlpA [Pseudohongiellaceae bacterium]|jgi:FKBP-type peptidyl-prolyl cis-trans isomerase SlpA